MMRESINEMIKQIADTCKSWVKEGEDGLLRFVDPIDGEEISAHYGATHAAVSFIIYGEKSNNVELAETGYRLLSSIIIRWNSIVNLPSFHNDFNNFALCAAWEYFENTKNKEDYAEKIKELVLASPDSNNPTVNWLPMRWYVNLVRYQWTSDEKYKAVCDKCRADIKAATYADGFIDDRLPRGLSFSLQYDVATVAVLQYLRSKGENIDISVEFGALLNAVAPDGDINYFGRGTNQIFAWGLWIYLLASSGKEAQLNLAMEYIKDKVPVMLKNNNMMLNDWPGEEKYMWWDYHYCSVYTAHFLLWLVLADEQYGKFPVKDRVAEPSDSGMNVLRDDDYFVVTFKGRKEYLAEKGPCIAALWTKSNGMVVKGTFGPWQGAFGNYYCLPGVTIRNNCGLYRLEKNRNFSGNRYLRKILSVFMSETAERIVPLFADMYIDVNEKEIRIVWNSDECEKRLLLVPCIGEKEITALVDGKRIRTLNACVFRNQYAWVSLYQTDIIEGRNWELIIRR